MITSSYDFKLLYYWFWSLADLSEEGF